ncbi:MAG: hypothetical protein GEV28_08780 [Actinophytocola sp.]|uniref:hypothetical protein n=1 Tax=Actinophytocola sp. TaxID=1872138 RepID=UPI00132A799A|nr:hypothetical protein [Actinophytocola sp.]MPZ80472.1 hypothetical protein [Actinophytocola sp.]
MAEGFAANLADLQKVVTTHIPNAVGDLQPILDDTKAVASEDFGEFSGELNAPQGVKFLKAKNSLAEGLQALLESVENCGLVLQEVHNRYLAAERATIQQLNQI